MKSCSTLFLALGLVSSAVLAQPAQPAPPSPGSVSGTGPVAPPTGAERMPAPAMGSGTQTPAEIQTPADTENGGGLSSGAPATQATTSGGGGQLITPDIAQSRPAAESTGITVKPHTENGVTYMCGGIGQDEAAYMKQAAAKDYDLMMTFAEKSGAYVANVDVAIKNARGKTVLHTKCDAPILLVDLPAGGNYRIHADAGGHTIDRAAAVKGGKGHARQVNFVWSASTAAAPGKNKGARKESSGSDRYGTESSGSDSGDSGSAGYDNSEHSGD